MIFLAMGILHSPQPHSKAASVCGCGGGVRNRKGSNKPVLLSLQATFQPSHAHPPLILPL